MMIPKIKNHFQGFESKTIIDIGNLMFFKKFVLLDIKEGKHLGLKEMQEISLIVSEYYQDQPFAYICSKTNSYSVNPLAYKRLNMKEAIKCIAVIKKNTEGFDLGVEKHFIKKPFEVFTTIDEASDWIDTFI